MSNFVEQLLAESPGGAKETVRARLRIAVTEGLQLQMERLGISKKVLAERIGVSRSAVTQALSSTRNLSLNTLADMADALGLDINVWFSEKQADCVGPQRIVFSRQIGSGLTISWLLHSFDVGTSVVTDTNARPSSSNEFEVLLSAYVGLPSIQQIGAAEWASAAFWPTRHFDLPDQQPIRIAGTRPLPAGTQVEPLRFMTA